MDIPAYNGRPLSIIGRFTGPSQNPHLWFWSNAKNLHMETPELAAQLSTMGYQFISETDQSEQQAIAATQFADAATFLINPEAATVKLYMLADDIERIRKYPISLAFSLDLPAKEISVPMLQFLPLPQIGEYGVIQGKKESAASIYHIDDLPEPARLLWQEMGQKLRALAAPGGWYLHSEMHTISGNEERYQQVRAEIEAESLHQADTKTQKSARMALQRLEEARLQVLDVRQSWQKPNWLDQWKDITAMAQELTASYYEHHHDLTRKARVSSLPDITSSTRTNLPSVNGGRALVQSFGPGIRMQLGLWNFETSAEQQLRTPNNSLLRVMGKNDGERIALHNYITDEMGPEGLKHLAGILTAYHNQTGGRERKEDAIVTPYGLLKMMGYDKKAEDKDEQRKLVNTILYLARTWIQSSEVGYELERGGRGGKRRRGVEYSPLIVLEALKPSQEGGIELPEKIEFHLGKEFYDLLFGDRQQFYTLPTAQILGYHGKNEQQEICLAYYLTNYLTINAGRSYDVYFPHLVEGSAIRLEESIERSTNRTRDALRTIYALEHLQNDGWFIRTAHEDMDMALAVEYYLKESDQDKLSPETYKRIINKHSYLQGKALLELRRLRRIALQNLLDGKGKPLQFKPGGLLKDQTEKLETARRKAEERKERAITARVIKAANSKKNRDLAEAKQEKAAND